ncbi:glycosyltransferase [Flavobacterium sp. LMO8]|jgi:glycosyltransferase involved in cell wall biosynthesis|uniref:glycosyltransferase family 2 protein n=1 Tax=Flavobacterium sp. LMO8 TaxID=2654244 RepID=UPI0012911724|nr:glycosyltransferase family 2 protein [Flavobacterium sp. LMO8]MQP24753.1 glycosyltransferase [Flavobacterium sp. LMO8]
MHNPLVSIIIPTYNRAHTIGATIDSVIAQSYQNWECLVVDDRGEDTTLEVIENYKTTDARINYLIRPTTSPKGASACRNYGLSQSKGEYVIFLDSDDVLMTYCLKERIAKILENTDKDFWVFPMYIQNENQPKETVTIPISENYLQDFLSCKVHWGIMCTTWNAHFVKKIKGFNEFYPRLNDPEVHIRAMLASKNNYSVFTDCLPDSIYMAAAINDKYKFAINYANSLKLFIPDICKELNVNGLANDKRYLKNYLNHYFLNFYQFNSRINNTNVLAVFYTNKIISFFLYLKILLLYYLFLIFNAFLKKIKQGLHKLFKKI